MYGYGGTALRFAAASWQWQPSPHDPANVLELADLAAGNQTLTGTLFADGDAFGAGVLSTSISITGTLYSDPDSFGAGVVSQGGSPQTITGTLYADGDTFPAGSLSTSIALTGTLYTNPDSFGAGVVTASIAITGTLFSDADSFGAGAISQAGGPQAISGALFVDGDSFGAGVVSVEALRGGGIIDDYTDQRRQRIERQNAAILAVIEEFLKRAA